MISFWLVVVALLLLTCLALVVPLWRREGDSHVSRSALNKALYKQRLKELEQEQQQGLIADGNQALVELQRSLLDDIPDIEPTLTQGQRWLWLPGVIVLVGLSLVLYWQLGSWQQVSRWQQANERFPTLSQRILVERDSNISEQDLLDFTLALRTQLKQDPSDYRGWLLLGRLALDGNDSEMGKDALSRAYQLAPKKSLVVVPYAQALMMSGDEVKAQQLLTEVISQEPNNVEARSVYAFMALQKEDYQTALSRWQAMLPLLEKGTPRYEMVIRSMEYATEQLKAQGKTAQNLTASADEKAAQVSSFNLQISLASDIVMPKDAHLFVFAVVANGPPMPIAVKKIAAPQLPMHVTISDEDGMMEGAKLAAYPALQFKARLAQGADVMNKMGAFEGSSAIVQTDSAVTKSIDIHIDHPL